MVYFTAPSSNLYFCGNGGCGWVPGKNKDQCPSFKLILRQQNTYKSAWIKKQSGGSYGTSDLFKWSVGVLRVSAQPIKLRKHSHQMAVRVLCETGVWQSDCDFFFWHPLLLDQAFKIKSCKSRCWLRFISAVSKLDILSLAGLQEANCCDNIFRNKVQMMDHPRPHPLFMISKITANHQHPVYYLHSFPGLHSWQTLLWSSIA